MNTNTKEYITGERLQMLCDVYLGTDSDFNYNPRISIEKHKHLNINSIESNTNNSYSYDNPRLIFCYSHCIDILNKLSIISKFANPFVLITHNSDYAITSELGIKNILNSEKLIHWFASNLMIPETDKISLLPLGIANSMWSHGNLSMFDNILIANEKPNNFYMNFKIDTNATARNECKTILEGKNLQYEYPNLSPSDNIKKLASYKYSICPIGNGPDTHRVWEALYTNTIPIVKNNVLNTTISKYISIIILDEWNDFNPDILLKDYGNKYENIKNNYLNNSYLYMSNWENKIKNKLAINY
jgi:hypothetical protein